MPSEIGAIKATKLEIEFESDEDASSRTISKSSYLLADTCPLWIFVCLDPYSYGSTVLITERDFCKSFY